MLAHSEKEQAAPTFKRSFGFHPLLTFCDHGPDGPGSGGEPLAGLLRTGRAGANDAADHITVLELALQQLPQAERGRVLVRGDAGAGTKAFLRHVSALGLQYSVGFAASDPVEAALKKLPKQAWTPAYDTDRQPRDGAQVAELTGLLADTLTKAGWPAGLRVIARRERPHPGAQLRLTDRDGWRITLFATNTPAGGPGRQLADLEARHRRRARAEDRIRALKDSGLRNLPLHDFAQNQIWLELVLLAADLLAWTATPRPAEHRGTPLGTQAAAATPVRRCRPPGHLRAANPPTARPQLALDPARPRRPHRPTRSANRLTPAPTTGARKPRQTRRSGTPASAEESASHRDTPTTQRRQDHETSRLGP